MNISQFFWNRMSQKIDRPSDAYEKAQLRAMAIIHKYLHPGDTVLDYGCGTGRITYALAGRVNEIHGIDFSAKMIETAKRKAEKSKRTNVEFSKTTIFDPKLKPESFNAVLAVGILHLLKDPRKEIRRIHALLKPGGLFLSFTPCMEENHPAISRISGIAFWLGRIGISPVVRFFRLSELEQCITGGKFQITETEKLSFDGTDEPGYIFSRFIAARKA
jgi:2-polyprenyl-3-methyl-5-hydroxy-6-metoxy-1,4-benzoquinol methylase